MKTSLIRTTHPQAIIDGWVDSVLGANDGGSTTIDPDVLAYGSNISVGDVVILRSDGSVSTTTTAQYTGIVGIALDDITAGDYGPIQWQGPVDLINVTGAVTAGYYAETSTVAGQAAQNATRRAGSFGYFTSSGTSPSGYIFGAVPDITSSTGADAVCDHGNMGATETIDVACGTWHRGTLNATCTITVTGFTVDEGLVVVFECSEDATGGWGITWDPDVVFIGDSQPDTAASTKTIFLLFSSAGDSTIYGAKVGGESAASISAMGFVGEILVADVPAGSPLVFADLLQNEAGTDLLYADPV